MSLRVNCAAAACLVVLACAAARAAEISVTVTGIEDLSGEIGCALYGASGEFLDPAASVSGQWVKARAGGVECRFTGLEPGAYAVAVLQDLNGNRTNDTNLLGIPTEPWGVSNNARPLFRAPTFEEAQVTVEDGGRVEISVELETTIP